MQGGTLRAEARSQQVTRVTIPGERGRVLDRNGKVLATSEDAADVIATPYQVENPGQTALRLHEVLGEPTTDLVSDARRSQLRLRLSRPEGGCRASPPGSRSSTSPGVSTVPDSKRLYPQGDLAAQVIGAVGTDNQGLTGLEHSENSVLGGANGEQDVVHDALGRPLRMETVSPASVGEDVQTTIDAAIQGKTEEALSAGRPALRREGRHGDRHEPQHRRGAGDGQLAGLQSVGPAERDPGGAGEPGHGLHLRAGLDLQGLHRRLRARRTTS